MLPAHAVLSMEAHGTGTPLGDPVEVGSLAAVATALPHIHVAALGSAKANIGHSEAPSGHGALVKTVIRIAQQFGPGNGQARVINPKVSSLLVTTWRTAALPTHSLQHTHAGGGVNAFGYSGTIAHMPVVRGGSHTTAANRAQVHYKRCLVGWAVPSLRPLLCTREDDHDTGGAILRTVMTYSSQPLSVDDSLQNLGLDSVSAVEMRLELQACSSIELPSTSLFDHPTLRELSVFCSVALSNEAGPRRVTSIAEILRSGDPLSYSKQFYQPTQVELGLCAVKIRPGAYTQYFVALHMPDGLCQLFDRFMAAFSGAVFGIEHGILRTGDPKYLGETLDEMAERYSKIIVAIGQACEYKQPILVGASFGALLAWAVGSHIPSDVSAFVLIDPPPPTLRAFKRNYTSKSCLEWRSAAAASLLIRSCHVTKCDVNEAAVESGFQSISHGAIDYAFAQSLCSIGMSSGAMMDLLSAKRRLDAWVHAQCVMLSSELDGMRNVRRCPVLLATSSNRDIFFETNEMPLSALELYFDSSQTVIIQGGHLSVLAQCCTGRNTSFDELLGNWITSTVSHSCM